jgi:hypothetical protein
MKKITLFFGASTIVLALVDQYQSAPYCSFSCLQNFDGLGFNWLVLVGGSLVISAILLFLPIKICTSWWKFARIAIPVIFVLSTLINLQLHHNSGGFMNLDNIFDIPALILMYSIFTIGSLIQIVRGYRAK